MRLPRPAAASVLAVAALPSAPAWPWTAAPLLLLVAVVTALRSHARALAARAAVTLLALALLSGCAAGPGPAARPASDRSTVQAAGGAAPAGIGQRAVAAARSRPALETSPFPTQVAVPGPPSVPVQLTIGRIGVSTRLVALGLDAGGALQVPDDFGRAGWFTGGPLPGEQGPAVIAGHVDSRSGPAVFYRLRELGAGDVVRVRRADGVTLRFTVDGVHQFPKDAFPRQAVFGTVAQQALRLVTCGGTFDPQRRSYRDNLVVDAHLTGFSRP
jgi:Sortase domain